MEEPNIIIKTALNEAVQKVNSGTSPSDALKKVAEEYDLNPNFIQRTGEALNVALNYRHFKTASDRSVDFQIADIPKVIQEVFSLNEKTSAEKISENFSVADNNSEVFNYNRILSNPLYKKAFLEINNAPEKNDSYPTTFRTVYEKAANYIQKLEKEYEYILTEKIAAEHELNCAFSNLSDEFKKDAGYRTTFEEFESQVFSKHGEQAIPYIDLLHKTAAKYEERGVHDPHYMMYDQSKPATMFDSLMDAAKTMIRVQKKADELENDLKYEKDFMRECKILMGKKSEEHSAKKEDEDSKNEENSKDSNESEKENDPVLEEVKKKENNPDYSVAKVDENIDHVKEAFLANIASGVILNQKIPDLVSSGASEIMSSSFKKKSFSGGHNTTLDNLERKLLLQELMLTDSILSKAPPLRVAKAYEQLLRLSPEISKEKEIVRSNLRAMVATQSLGNFDADLLTKLETGLVKRKVISNHFYGGDLNNIKV